MRDTTVAVLDALVQMEESDDPPSIRGIADITGLSPHGVHAQLLALEDAGLAHRRGERTPKWHPTGAGKANRTKRANAGT